MLFMISCRNIFVFLILISTYSILCRGGAMFLEDGVEIGNTFDGNLAVFVRTSSSLLNEDVTPAAIWVISFSLISLWIIKQLIEILGNKSK